MYSVESHLCRHSIHMRMHGIDVVQESLRLDLISDHSISVPCHLGEY